MAAFDDYLRIGGYLDAGLKQQALFDLAALERATGRTFTKQEQERFLEVQHQALRWTFLGSGMSHANVLETFRRLAPRAGERLAEVAPAFS